MKLTQESKQTPTYRQYVLSSEFVVGSKHEVDLVLLNPEWKSITFFGEAFKLSFKYKTNDEFNKQSKAVSKILSKPCQVWMEAESPTIGNLHLNSASDADEDFQLFESSERGFQRTR